jgi:hypothetical protein
MKKEFVLSAVRGELDMADVFFKLYSKENQLDVENQDKENN